MDKFENKWDKKLKIETVGIDNSSEDFNHYPYEPTPYAVLERLATSGYLSNDSFLVDYGSGKGRVDLFLSWKLNCKTLGIEFNANFYEMALINKNESGNDQADFLLMNAEDYEVDLEVDSFYFFNPFSLKILQTVIARIKESWYIKPRKMQLFFYYPFKDYVSFLMNDDNLKYIGKIDCRDLFVDNDNQERILIFTLE